MSLYGERTFTLVFQKRIIMAATVSFGMPYASRIFSIFPLCMEWKALVKSTNSIVACRLKLCMVVTVSVGGFVADQMQYNLKSAQYLWQNYNNNNNNNNNKDNNNNNNNNILVFIHI